MRAPSIPRTHLLRHTAAVALLVASLLPAGPARALNYKPKENETLSHIALIHYGNPKKFIYLMTANGIADPSQLEKGKTLWIPTTWSYKIKKGDSIAQIASKYLEDSERAGFLLWLNKIQDPRSIETSTLIHMPFVLKHRVQQGQSMVDVAKQYYFRSEEAGLLRKYNKKKTNALKAGEVILVPIFDPETQGSTVSERLKRNQDKTKEIAREAKAATVHATKETEPAPTLEPAGDPDPKSQPEPKGSVEQKPATGPIVEARGLYHNGDFELARTKLEKLLEGSAMPKIDETSARELLASALVALDRKKEAEHEFVRLLMVDPSYTLDPLTTSPKILRIFQTAKNAR